MRQLGRSPFYPPLYGREDQLSPVDESPDFHDPYSELTLFLAQKVKEECQEEGGGLKKWSPLLQDQLMEKIQPEFQSKFPTYRLGAYALKKTWEKLSYYSQQIQAQKEALTSEGRLDLGFLIKENLRHYFQTRTISDPHPYRFAHQAALKISDCMATMEGVRPMLDHLAKTIWSVERHLLAGDALREEKSPYDDWDAADKLIVKSQLEILGSRPDLSQKELIAHVVEGLTRLSTPSEGEITEEIGAIRIDHPDYSLSHARHIAEMFFQRAKEVLDAIKPSDLHRKVELWTVQGDLLFRWLKLTASSPLLDVVTEVAKAAPPGQPHGEVWGEAAYAFSTKYPHLGSYLPQIVRRSGLFYKYAWYTLLGPSSSSSVDRFVAWHRLNFKDKPEEEVRKHLEEMFRTKIPLIPFDAKLLAPKEISTESDQRYA
jgi:hypothetical protein